MARARRAGRADAVYDVVQRKRVVHCHASQRRQNAVEQPARVYEKLVVLSVRDFKQSDGIPCVSVLCVLYRRAKQPQPPNGAVVGARAEKHGRKRNAHPYRGILRVVGRAQLHRGRRDGYAGNRAVYPAVSSRRERRFRRKYVFAPRFCERDYQLRGRKHRFFVRQKRV